MRILRFPKTKGGRSPSTAPIRARGGSNLKVIRRASLLGESDETNLPVDGWMDEFILVGIVYCKSIHSILSYSFFYAASIRWEVSSLAGLDVPFSRVVGQRLSSVGYRWLHFRESKILIPCELHIFLSLDRMNSFSKMERSIPWARIFPVG